MLLLDDIHLLAESTASIACSLKKITACICERPGSFTVTHLPKETETMATCKPKSFGMKRSMKAAPAAKGDTVTIGGFLNTDGTPYTGGDPTVVPTSSDLTTLTTGTVSGLTYPETFLQAGTVTVSIAATFPDGTVVTQVDTVVITASPTVPGSFTVTHSLPIV